MERELRSDLELEADEQRESGLSREEARYAALKAFGNTTLVKEDIRHMWGWTTLEQLIQDLRYAMRGMRKAPGFTIVAILSLAIGIGATTAVFSILNAVVLRPLPVAHPERLVILQPELRGKRFVFFNPLFEQMRESQKTLSGMVAISDEPYLKAAIDHAAPIYVRGSLASGDYFQLLGVSAAIGRLLTPQDDDPSAQDCAAVISYAFWTTALHSDPTTLGRPVTVREKICTIVGVGPASFRGHESGYTPDFWLPLRPLTDPKLLASRTMAFFSGVLGRLRPETVRGQAESELTALYQRVQVEGQRSPFPGQPPPKPNDFTIVVKPGAQGLDGLSREFGRPLVLALAVVGVVLLIAG